MKITVGGGKGLRILMPLVAENHDVILIERQNPSPTHITKRLLDIIEF